MSILPGCAGRVHKLSLAVLKKSGRKMWDFFFSILVTVAIA